MKINHDLVEKPASDKITPFLGEFAARHETLQIKKKSVFIGIPTYDAKCHVAFAMALMNNIKQLERAGYTVNCGTAAGHCHITTSRNELAWAFLMSDCDSLIMMDVDEWCEDGAFVKLMEHDVELVCGVCPRKLMPINFTARTYINMTTNKLLIDPDTLLVQLEAAPTGLIRIKRVVFDALIKAMGDELYYEENGGKRYDFFEMVRRDRRRWGEDYAFSHKWNSIGGKCWARPDITFKHFGQAEFEGNYAEYITANMHADGTVNEEPISKVA